MKKISLILIVVLLSGCGVERKIRKATEIVYANPDRFAKPCADLFPVKENYIKGKDSIVYKEVEVKGDSIPCPANEKGEVVKVKCPDAKIQYKDVFRTDTIVKENTAKAVYLEAKIEATEDQLKESNKELEKHKKRAEKLLFWLISLGIVLGGGVYFTFVRR